MTLIDTTGSIMEKFSGTVLSNSSFKYKIRLLPNFSHFGARLTMCVFKIELVFSRKKSILGRKPAKTLPVSIYLGPLWVDMWWENRSTRNSASFLSYRKFEIPVGIQKHICTQNPKAVGGRLPQTLKWLHCRKIKTNVGNNWSAF